MPKNDATAIAEELESAPLRVERCVDGCDAQIHMRSMFRSRRARQQLVDVLGMIAGYNDKGADWSGHDAVQVQRFRQRAQERILRIVASIGEQNISPALLEGLKSGRAVEDSSGSFTSAAQDELL